MPDFRSTIGVNPQWHTTGGVFSNFEFVDTRFESNPILRRVLSLARKLGYEGMLEEEITDAQCALLATENAALAIRLPDFQGSHVTRLSFFKSSDREHPGEFLGYAVLKQDTHTAGPFTHVYEAVLRPPRDQRHNNFCHRHQSYVVRTSLGDFSVSGTLYAQQNDATFVCAHAALRTLLSCLLPARDVSYADINRWAGVDHANAALQVGSRGLGAVGRGLNSGKIETILQAAGFQPELVVHEPLGTVQLPSGVDFQRMLYGFLESGLPLLLGFELTPGGRHIIPVFGHTFNEDLWVPEAERNYFSHDRGYFPSESWLSSYLAHDDNFGPYVCLPRHYLAKDQFRLLVGLKPYASTIGADQAEALALDFAIYLVTHLSNTGLGWLDRQLAFTSAQLLVLRSLLISRVQYLAHLQALRDREGFDLEPALLLQLGSSLPDSFWLVELSVPELFPNSRRKFGEVMVASGNGGAVVDPVLACRAPGLVVLRTAAGLVSHRTRLAGHTDLFRLS